MDQELFARHPYGAADSSVCPATAKLDDLLACVQERDYLSRVGHAKGMVR